MIYVCGFAFDHNAENILLIRKKRPAWQNGRFNGIGGRIMEGEGDLHAMVREFKEETGVATKPIEWTAFAYLHGGFGSVSFFSLRSDGAVRSARTVTDEEVSVLKVQDVIRFQDHSIIPNLRFLIPLALDQTTRRPVAFWDDTP